MYRSVAKSEKTSSNALPESSGRITIKSPRELELMRRAGRMVAAVLALLRDAVKPGIATRELDTIASREIKRLGGKATFKGYHGFPASVCTSINDEIVHGIPGGRTIGEGDLVKIDVGVSAQGYIGDAAITVGAGEISPEARSLLEVTEQALEEGIKVARDGAHLGDIGAAIESCARAHGYSVVREYAGHGVGRSLHEEPQVFNYGAPGTGPRLRSGMTLAIEPMVNIGDWRTRVLENKWTVVTLDGSLSAHFEHSVAIRDGEAEVLTRS